MTEKSLKGAYSIKTPEDSVALYRDWAATYDTEFAAAHGYVMPVFVAEAFRDAGGTGPVLDVGAGTGLVGAALADTLPGIQIDGIDISQEMLDQASAKGVYRRCIQADLTQPLDLPDGTYAGFTSAGTFTHGHVGPVCLPELMRVARPGALFVLTIKPEVFDGAGFGSAFAGLVADGLIEPIDWRHIPVYAGADHDHAEDTGLLAICRRR